MVKCADTGESCLEKYPDSEVTKAYDEIVENTERQPAQGHCGQIGSQRTEEQETLTLQDPRCKMRQFIIAFLAILITGCVPLSDNPLTDPDKENMDSSLYGTWYWKAKDESGYLHIGLDHRSKLLRIVMLDIDKQAELELSEFLGHTSVLGENKYLNLKKVSLANKTGSGYLFVKYDIQGDLLAISILGNNTVKKAIEDGKLKGQVTKSKWSSSVRVTEDQEKLKRFILENDTELFRETNHLHRLELPDRAAPPSS